VRKRRRNQQAELEHGLIAATIARYPREFVGIVMAVAATLTIFVNALFLQRGPHPAPIFAARPFLPRHSVVAPPRAHPAVPAPPPSGDESARSQAQTVSDIQRELTARGFYQGTVDGIWGAKTDAAARDFVQAAHLNIDPAPGEGLLQAIKKSSAKASGLTASDAAVPVPGRKDPIAALIAPSKNVLAIQHALADFGYGQIKPTGVYDEDTRAAIEKFERDRHMPVDGQISERFVRALAAMTGRPLE
jgi:peptidoglycan hydrolase-like protein with peptidoglycan-binding domain